MKNNFHGHHKPHVEGIYRMDTRAKLLEKRNYKLEEKRRANETAAEKLFIATKERGCSDM